MKNLKEFITEGWASQNNEWEVSNAGEGKFGFMSYDENSGLISVISFDKLDEFAKKQGLDPEDYKNIDKLKVGQSTYADVSMIYTRIW